MFLNQYTKNNPFFFWVSYLFTLLLSELIQDIGDFTCLWYYVDIFQTLNLEKD